MTDVPAKWGFNDTQSLAAARRAVLAAIRSGNLAENRAAWVTYQELAEATIEPLPNRRTWARSRRLLARLRLIKQYQAWTSPWQVRSIWYALTAHIPPDNPYAKAQIGLILDKAGIWRGVQDRVGYWRELLHAARFADNMGYDEIWEDVREALARAAISRSFYAEFLQAHGRYDAAMLHYIDREQDECLTDRERGLVNLRLAQCYDALQDDMDEDGQASMQGLIEATIASAIEYLKGEPEQLQALRFLEAFEERTTNPSL
jgi:hypothetical protein